MSLDYALKIALTREYWNRVAADFIRIRRGAGDSDADIAARLRKNFSVTDGRNPYADEEMMKIDRLVLKEILATLDAPQS